MSATLVVNAFLQGKAKNSTNTKTNGQWLSLFNNIIAEHRSDGMYVTNCGWFTKTTAERLRRLPDVSLVIRKKKWYLNDVEWDGGWVKVNSDPIPSGFDPVAAAKQFDLSQAWVSTDGWRGYNEPKYAVAGANDTGGWDDSPCPSHVATAELDAIKKALGKIPHKEVVCDTSNVFCVHRYIVVPPFYVEQADAIVKGYIADNDTSLLYSVQK